MDTAFKQSGMQAIENDLTEAERRADERHATLSYLRAVDTATGDVLGTLEDISLGGFKLQVLQTLQRRATYALHIEVRIDGRAVAPIEVTARNVWVHKFEFEPCSRAGFVFVDLAPATRNRITALFPELQSAV
jgi:c-di-GMP-binding flagellar brake protein YcgR